MSAALKFRMRSVIVTAADPVPAAMRLAPGTITLSQRERDALVAGDAAELKRLGRLVDRLERKELRKGLGGHTMTGGANDKSRLKVYAEVIAMWCARFDTREIADRLGISEAMAANWVANFRAVARADG